MEGHRKPSKNKPKRTIKQQDRSGPGSPCQSVTCFIGFPWTNVFVGHSDIHAHTTEAWRLGKMSQPACSIDQLMTA